MAMIICNECGKNIHHTAIVCPRCGAAQKESKPDNLSPAISDKQTSTFVKKKMYSPTQVGLGTFLGGPLAGTYFLKRNFDSLSKDIESKKTLIIGLIFSVAMITVLLILKDKFPNFPYFSIVALYMAPVMLVNKQNQLTKESIRDSSEYDFQSNWKVLGLSIAWFIAFLGMTIMISAVLYFMGIKKLV